jgi:hypothetical protein
MRKRDLRACGVATHVMKSLISRTSKGEGLEDERGVIMAANFRILSRRNGRTLHVKLVGDFDGSSAFELLHFIEDKSSGIAKVFIHTGGLKHVYPFGLDTFRNNLNILSDKPIRFTFAGENAAELSLGKSSFSPN